MRAIGVLPARMAATRFPGKILAPMLGMPMLGHCYHRTRLAPGLQGAYVATCDEEIAAYARSIGAPVVMTAVTHNRATTRTAEAVDTIERDTGEPIDVVVMVQADEPLIAPETIAATLAHFADPTVTIVNIMSRLRTHEACEDPNNVKVVVDKQANALYFSREPIPSIWKGWDGPPRYMQTGIIAFRRDALRVFNAMDETMLEQIESVDMNRVLENGGRIRMVPTDAMTLGVDTPQELVEAEDLLREDANVDRYLHR